MVGTGQGARHGVLVRDARALESMEKIDTLVVDKTGTLTEGKPQVTGIHLAPGSSLSENELLQAVASVESHSEHPLGGAIVRTAQERNLSLLPVANFESVPGKGVSAIVDGPRGKLPITAGNATQVGEAGVNSSALLPANPPQESGTTIFAAVNGNLAGTITIADAIRPSTPETLKNLRGAGIDVIMATGDSRAIAERLAAKLGITRVEAEVLPARKAELIRELQQKGKRVAMAGDGVNDAPALAQADVGIAMGTGTDVALESGDIALLKGDLRGIMRARRLSKAVMRNIRQNLFFAFVYNAVGIPLAAGALYPLFHLNMNPIFAAAAMSLSSVSVISNSLRLRNLKI
jgi:P-type Cu+ transporter